MAEAATSRTIFREIGSSGLNLQQGQFLQEEFKRELQGRSGVKVYTEMGLTPIVGAILFVIEQMVCQVEWKINPFSEDPQDQKPKDFIQECWEDMSSSPTDTLSETCTMFQFGWAFQELVYKVRMGNEADPPSKFDDRKIGWRKWPLRGQGTLSGWDLDDNGGVRGMIQELNYPRHETVTIPIEKALLFRTRVERGNPEGLSVLRRGYRNWWYAKRYEEIEAIGVERDAAGLPVFTPPADLDIWNPNDKDMVMSLSAAQKLVTSIRRGEKEGIVKPFGWELELLSAPSRRQFDIGQIVNRHETRIAQSALADFIFLGQGKTGSWALSSDKTDLFILALAGYLKKIKDVINRHAIPRLLELNGMDVSRAPMIEHGDIETQNLQELAQYLTALGSVGAILFPDPKLEDHLRMIAKFPPRPDEEDLPEREPVRVEPPEVAEAKEDVQKAVKKLRELREVMQAKAKNNGHMSGGLE